MIKFGKHDDDDVHLHLHLHLHLANALAFYVHPLPQFAHLHSSYIVCFLIHWVHFRDQSRCFLLPVPLLCAGLSKNEALAAMPLACKDFTWTETDTEVRAVHIMSTLYHLCVCVACCDCVLLLLRCVAITATSWDLHQTRAPCTIGSAAVLRGAASQPTRVLCHSAIAPPHVARCLRGCAAAALLAAGWRPWARAHDCC